VSRFAVHEKSPAFAGLFFASRANIARLRVASRAAARSTVTPANVLAARHRLTHQLTRRD